MKSALALRRRSILSGLLQGLVLFLVPNWASSKDRKMVRHIRIAMVNQRIILRIIGVHL